jgi:hypothetical protein
MVKRESQAGLAAERKVTRNDKDVIRLHQHRPPQRYRRKSQLPNRNRQLKRQQKAPLRERGPRRVRNRTRHPRPTAGRARRSWRTSKSSDHGARLRRRPRRGLWGRDGGTLPRGASLGSARARTNHEFATTFPPLRPHAHSAFRAPSRPVPIFGGHHPARAKPSAKGFCALGIMEG